MTTLHPLTHYSRSLCALLPPSHSTGHKVSCHKSCAPCAAMTLTPDRPPLPPRREQSAPYAPHFGTPLPFRGERVLSASLRQPPRSIFARIRRQLRLSGLTSGHSQCRGNAIATGYSLQSGRPLQSGLTARRTCGHAVMPRLLTPSLHYRYASCSAPRALTPSPSHRTPPWGREVRRA